MSDNVFDMFSEGTSQSAEGGEISTDVTEGNIFFLFFFLSFSKSNRVTLEW